MLFIDFPLSLICDVLGGFSPSKILVAFFIQGRFVSFVLFLTTLYINTKMG